MDIMTRYKNIYSTGSMNLETQIKCSDKYMHKTVTMPSTSYSKYSVNGNCFSSHYMAKRNLT